MSRPNDLPRRPFDLCTSAPFRPAGRRSLGLAGATVELAWLPERATRPGAPTAVLGSPFRRDRAARILRDEALWRGAGLVLTPNRFPFGERQLVLWSAAAAREPTREMLELAFEIADREDATALWNSTGAAASIPRAHVHLLAERRDFLEMLPCTAFRPRSSSEGGFEGLEVLRLLTCFAGIELRGTAPARAEAAHRLLTLRTSPAANLCASPGRCWVIPRSREIPAPHFPHALGAAELWGRWCFSDEAAFRHTTASDLERALELACYPPGSTAEPATDA